MEARFALGLEADGPPGAEGDIPKVAQARALVSFLDVGIGAADTRPGRAFDAVNEIALMDRAFHALPWLPALVPGLDAFFHEPPLAVRSQGALLAGDGSALACAPPQDTI